MHASSPRLSVSMRLLALHCLHHLGQQPPTWQWLHSTGAGRGRRLGGGTQVALLVPGGTRWRPLAGDPWGEWGNPRAPTGMQGGIFGGGGLGPRGRLGTSHGWGAGVQAEGLCIALRCCIPVPCTVPIQRRCGLRWTPVTHAAIMLLLVRAFARLFLCAVSRRRLCYPPYAQCSDSVLYPGCHLPMPHTQSDRSGPCATDWMVVEMMA